MNSKILPYLEKVVTNLIKDTEYKIHTVNYGGIRYTGDIKYFENYYGLSEDETETVLNMFLLKFSSIIYDEMGKHKTF